MSNQLTLIEHKSLYISKNGKIEFSEGNIGISEKAFNEVKLYILQHKSNSTMFMTPDYTRKYGETLKAKQYVGVIETNSGISIEILPKIYPYGIDNIRPIFIKMLKELKSFPFKSFNSASLASSKMPIFEIFIKMFLEELTILIKKGIKSDYTHNEENSNYLKGKLRVAEHLRRNVVHKEKLSIEFDEYQLNRIENQIIKKTLEVLYMRSKNSKNKKKLREFIFTFNEVQPLKNIKNVFTNIKLDRHMRDYKIILKWCKLFLNSKSITPFKGNIVAFALFFNMNRIFEDYVSHCLKKNFPERNIKTQVAEKFLLTRPKEKFRLKPDILIDNEIVADTKWKVINPHKSSYDISQLDIYQMFAYGMKYDVKIINLIYPYIDNFPDISETKFFFDDDLLLQIHAFDCSTGKLVNPKCFIG